MMGGVEKVIKCISGGLTNRSYLTFERQQLALDVSKNIAVWFNSQNVKVTGVIEFEKNRRYNQADFVT